MQRRYASCCTEALPPAGADGTPTLKKGGALRSRGPVTEALLPPPRFFPQPGPLAKDLGPGAGSASFLAPLPAEALPPENPGNHPIPPRPVFSVASRKGKRFGAGLPVRPHQRKHSSGPEATKLGLSGRLGKRFASKSMAPQLSKNYGRAQRKALPPRAGG